LNSKYNFFFLIFFAGLILAYFQTVRIDAPNYDLKLIRHTSIIENNIEYPYKYRLLNPFTANAWFTALKLVFPDKPAFLAAYFIQNLIVYNFLLFSLFSFFKLWFSQTGALISLLVFIMLVPLSLTGYDTLGDMTTAGLMALGFYFLCTDKIKFIFPLIFIGSFNELQVILLIAFYFFSVRGNYNKPKIWLNSFAMLAVFLIGYIIIYLIRGGSAGSDDFLWYFTKDAAFNLANKDWIPLWIIMIAPLLFFALKNLKSKPQFLVNGLIIVIPLFYFIAFFFIARMREIDKALTIFTILIPLAVYSLFPNHVINHKTDNQKS
jgi:hypothetical protein